MDETQIASLLKSSELYPIPQSVKLSYGTAGFRADASLLESTVYRVGILSSLRSLKLKPSTVGLMITASHNRVSDNGVKVSDPSGGMLSQEWEPFADQIANASYPRELVSLIRDFAEKEEISMGGSGGAELHWMVRAKNRGVKATESDYFESLSTSFKCLIDLIPVEKIERRRSSKLVLDGANGVGGQKMEVLRGYLKGKGCALRVLKDDVGMRCASFDGDADRLVYFYVLSSESCSGDKVELLGGDKILSLFALFIKEQLNTLGDGEGKETRLGVVQTAYANAAEYDVGIYFEANGHGTILFSESFLSWLVGKQKDLSQGSEKHNAVSRLVAVSNLINQAVGDALSGLLLVEVILQHMGWSVQKWNELYKDLPSRQVKVEVPDITAVVTTSKETEALKPLGIQDAINGEIKKYQRGRDFIRPSGTEDVVRVYAEASTQEDADSLANSVSQLVKRFLGSS
ncbi:hypothetical protein Bca4012_011831 [Brassica carinata]